MASKLTEKLLEDLERYLKGKMTGIERQQFEENLASDEELRNELRLQIGLYETFDNSEDYSLFKDNLNRSEINVLKAKLRSKEYQDLSTNIRKAEKVYFNQKTKVKPIQKYYRYFGIAGMIILFVAIYFFQSVNSYATYYNQYVNWEELPSFIEKSQPKNTFSNAEIAFKRGNYTEAVALFSTIEATDELYPYSVLYLGACYDKLDENKKAIATFQQLANLENSLISSQGTWYEAMIYLKMNDKENAIKALQKNTDNPDDFNYQKAKILVRKLD